MAFFIGYGPVTKVEVGPKRQIIFLAPTLFAICKGPVSAVIKRLDSFAKAPNCLILNTPQAILAFASFCP